MRASLLYIVNFSPARVTATTINLKMASRKAISYTRRHYTVHGETDDHYPC